MNITGRITRSAEVKTTANGKTVVNFSIGISNSFTNKSGEKIRETTFYDCNFWRTAKIAPYLTKGTVVELSGRIGTRAWLDKENKPKAGLNITISEIAFHGGNSTNQNGQTVSNSVTNGGAATATDENDDLPF